MGDDALTESPVVLRSLAVHSLLLCMALVVWSLLGFESAEYSLPVLYTDPVRWGLTCAYMFGGLSGSVFVLAWAMKQRVVYVETTWADRPREISFDEYLWMVSEYRHEYRSLLQQYDSRLLLVIIAMAALTGAFPFVTMSGVPLIVLFTPYLLSLFLISIGLALTRLFYQIAPNSATRHFQFVSPRRLKRAHALLDQIPAFSWTGIEVNLSEAGGFYRIGKPVVAGRIDGMEATALVTVEIDSRGRPVLARSKIKAHGTHPETTIQRVLRPPGHVTEFRALVIDTILKYLGGTDDPSLASDSLIALGALAEQDEEEDLAGLPSDTAHSSDDESV